MHHEFCTGKETLKMNDTGLYFLTISECPGPKVKELKHNKHYCCNESVGLGSVHFPSVPGHSVYEARRLPSAPVPGAGSVEDER